MKKMLLMKRKTSNAIILIIASVVGAGSFLYPFVFPPPATTSTGAQAISAAPVMFLVLLPVLLILIFGGLLRQGGSKEIALLGALAAINVTLRFVPLPLGGSAIFFLLILAGCTWGASFGFALGSLTILISAFWAGGLGPWVPFEMVATGWVGMSGALFQPWARGGARRGFIIFLAVISLIWGYLYGGIMNLWFWPYLGHAGRGAEAIKQYGVFYLATSAVWDTGRAAVNFLLVLFLGGPILKVFERFKKRFDVEYL
jgi:energy-coupling factor transport system substrate-specific component